MRRLPFFATLGAMFVYAIAGAQSAASVSHFEKAIISPHIKVTFVQGNEESVRIDGNITSPDQLVIDVHHKTLRLYLRGAQEITRNQTVYEEGKKTRRPIYDGTIVTATVTYKTLIDLSVRGEETVVCKSTLTADVFKLKIFGQADVILYDVRLGQLKATIYGESVLDILSGTIKNQRYTTYGESKINSISINGSTSQITAYGEGDFKINVADAIKITSYGQASLTVAGHPAIAKGLHFGEMHIDRIN